MTEKNLYIILWLLLCLTIPDVLMAQTFTISSNKAIPNNSTITDTITLTGTGISLNSSFGLEKICLNIDHNSVGQLTIDLIAPNDITVNLFDNRGGSLDDFINTCFDGDINSPGISIGVAPYTGSFLPEEPLGFINNGSIADGNWIIRINDNSIITAGTLIDFSITFSDNPAIVPGIANDDCANSIQIPINPNYTCLQTIEGSINGATNSEIVGCDGYTGFDDDAWFHFIAEDSVHLFEISNIIGSTQELVYEVFGSTCGNLVSLGCFNVETFQIHDFTIGNTYYLRVASEDQNPHNSIFDVCIKDGIPGPPPNDDICYAYDMSSGCVFSATVAGALPSYITQQGCSGSGGFLNDIFFTFTATEGFPKFIMSNLQGSSKAYDFQILSGTLNCPSSSHSLTSVYCDYDPIPGSQIEFIPNNALNIGQTYYIRISTYSSPQNSTFDLCIDSANPPPNDNCGNAIVLVSDNCTADNYTLVDATASTTSASCGGFDDDVWFTFEAISTNHTISIFDIVGGDGDLIYEVFQGSCNEPILAHCFDDPVNEIIVLNELVIGANYFLRVASFQPGTNPINFKLCIESGATCGLLVLSSNDSGPFTLRDVYDCASPGSTIVLSGSIAGETIFLTAPGILFDKDIVILNEGTQDIIISNEDINNNQVLLDVNSNVDMYGIQIQGKSISSMITTIRNTGTLRFH